jgi:hypothetical protein
VGLSANGFVVGRSTETPVQGTTAGVTPWLYDSNEAQLFGFGDNLKNRIGPTSLAPLAVNDNGQVVGSGNGGLFGDVVWYYDHETRADARLIGLLDEEHRRLDGRAETTYLDMNTRGEVVGYSRRLGGSSGSRSAWFFDPVTGKTTPLVFSESRRGDAFTDIRYFDDEGRVFGIYDAYNEAGEPLGKQPFYWDPTSGFAGIDDLIVGGSLAEQGWTELFPNQFIDGLDFIVGDGSRLDRNSLSFALVNCDITLCTGLAVVPEPLGLSIVSSAAIVGIVALRRPSVSPR